MATCCKKFSGEKELSPDAASDPSRWMEKLPDRLHDVPLNQLAIPGSHDSFTFYLDKSGPIAPDEQSWLQELSPLIQKLGILGQYAMDIFYNWSTAQSLSVCDQLNAGIRYFDIRVGARAQSSELYCVHGLFGPKIEDCMEKIALFLDDHASEVVILDFNHFYDVSQESHRCLIDKILKRFPSKLCPPTDMKEVTLKFMSERGYRLIVFYQDNIACDHPQLWGKCRISSPWPNTPDVHVLLKTLTENFTKSREISKFYVTQGVLTLTEEYVIANLLKTLKETLARDAAKPFVEWLKSKTAGREGINICIMDSVELENYVASVIQLNYSLIE